MNYKFFTNSQRSWKAMFETILNAQKSIYLEMYIFNDDMEQYNFFSLVKKKAEQGLKVKIILDSFGSHDLTKNKINELRNSGIELFFISYFFHRTHRKILIIDESVAFIGGVNFHQNAKLWSDLVVRIKGKKIVGAIIKSFAKAYINAGGKDENILNKRDKKWNNIKTWIVDHFPVAHKYKLKLLYIEHINNAHSNITLITPYFMPKRWLSSVLHQAVLRGVSVEILVPKKTDHFIIDRINYFYIYKLSKVGVKFFLKENMNHAKAMILDNNEAMIGSQNLDFLSFGYNSEIGVFFNNTKIVTQLLKISEKWKGDSVFFDYKNYKPEWFDYVLSPFIKIFFKIF
ncbi:MAG: phosphatidylserine/phosphatidylglycerophosphate/cardiolipin synthase family protein [Candidatus Nomurabacteria bacterium]|nr:phosphatidylserine/phosphatidylglycerophosphate/cardiolipin synthase family protein [Candidatus Nomurabacteria bacterium]